MYSPVEEALAEVDLELLQGIKLFSIPLWVKAAIIALLAVLGLINTAVFFVGITNEHREGWVKASVELLSVVLPIFILALVLWKSEAGVESLRRKTEEFFLSLLPSVLVRIVEADAVFFEAKKDHQLEDLHTAARVLVNLQKSDCYSDVVVLAPDSLGYVEVAIRLEINVKKVNFNLCLDEQLVRERFAEQSPHAVTIDHENMADVADWLTKRFRHTMGGAGLQGTREHAERKQPAGAYQFNPTLLRRTVGGRTALCIVASCSVAPDFLYDPSERLYFAQDLMFFLRSFLTEGRDLFRTIPKDGVGQAIADLGTRRVTGIAEAAQMVTA